MKRYLKIEKFIEMQFGFTPNITEIFNICIAFTRNIFSSQKLRLVSYCKQNYQ